MDIMVELERAGAVLLNRHFVYKSGKHGSGYINLDTIFPNVGVVSDLCADLIAPFLGVTETGDTETGGVDTVAAPAVGGIVLSVLAGCAFRDAGRSVSAIWADKNGDDFAFERAGFTDQLRGKRVLVVEDLLTTGGSVAKVCRQAERHGAEIVGVSVVCNRGGVTASQLGVARLEALTSVSFTAVDPGTCSLCVAGTPIVDDIGHGGAYKAEHPTYKGGYISVSTTA
ncbi:MAG: phosphoribosyltransferase family protein [Mycobacteriales bacterium]